MLPLLIHVLGKEQPEIQAVACEGVAKLMLAGMVYDDVVSPGFACSDSDKVQRAQPRILPFGRFCKSWYSDTYHRIRWTIRSYDNV
jgi:hypothetical protein